MFGANFFRVLRDRVWHVKPASSVFEAEGKVGCLVGLALRSVQALTELPLAQPAFLCTSAGVEGPETMDLRP